MSRLGLGCWHAVLQTATTGSGGDWGARVSACSSLPDDRVPQLCTVESKLVTHLVEEVHAHVLVDGEVPALLLRRIDGDGLGSGSVRLAGRAGGGMARSIRVGQCVGESGARRIVGRGRGRAAQRAEVSAHARPSAPDGNAPSRHGHGQRNGG